MRISVRFQSISPSLQSSAAHSSSIALIASSIVPHPSLTDQVHSLSDSLICSPLLSVIHFGFTPSHNAAAASPNSTSHFLINASRSLSCIAQLLLLEPLMYPFPSSSNSHRVFFRPYHPLPDRSLRRLCNPRRTLMAISFPFVYGYPIPFRSLRKLKDDHSRPFPWIGRPRSAFALQLYSKAQLSMWHQSTITIAILRHRAHPAARTIISSTFPLLSTTIPSPGNPPVYFGPGHRSGISSFCFRFHVSSGFWYLIISLRDLALSHAQRAFSIPPRQRLGF